MRSNDFLIEIQKAKRKRKRKKSKAKRYGAYFYPYYGFGSTDSTSDGGGGDGGGMAENKQYTMDEVKKFKKWACKRLSIKNPPKITLSYNTKEAQTGHHTGKHIEGSDSVWVYVNNRNLVDILRTVFHELVHWRQSELGMIEHGDSYPGSAIEAMADMLAGKYIKIYGKDNQNIFQ
jgi:hypothetical protein